MQQRITVPKATRPWRRWAVLTLGLFWFCTASVAAPLNGAWRSAKADDTPASVLLDFQLGRLQTFAPAQLKRFPPSPLGTWVVIAPQPPWDNSARVLSIYPAPPGQVTVYANGQGHALAIDDFSAPTHGHGRLAWQVPSDLAASTPIVLKLEAGSSLSTPISFRMQSMPDYLHTDAQWLVFAASCFAVMLAMMLMALCFAVMLRDFTFAWYAGYVFCYALIQGLQTGFVFHPLRWEWLAGSSMLAGMAAVALSVAFAAIFMMRFCELQRYAAILRVPIMALAAAMIGLVLMRSSQVGLLIELARLLLNPLLMLGAALLLLAAVVAAVRGSRPAWFFLVGWTPLLILTAMTSAQVNGALASVPWLNDASLAGGAIEALVLSLGLADRALIMRREGDSVRVLADHDALTSLLNRRAWSERSSVLLASGEPRPMVMLFMDLDHFKLLNDRQGHSNGDRALVAVAKALAAELRPTDLLGRYGGEEFVALLDGTGEEQALQVATRLCRRVHRLEIPTSDESLPLTVSIGIAMRKEGDDIAALAERADQAMYAAKLNGRNQVSLYSPTRTPRITKARLHVVEQRKSDR